MALIAASLLLATASICVFFFTPAALGLRLPWIKPRAPISDPTSKAGEALQEKHDSAKGMTASPSVSTSPSRPELSHPPSGTSTAAVPSIALDEPAPAAVAQEAPSVAQTDSQRMPPPPAPPPKSPKRGVANNALHAPSPPVPLPQRSASLRAPTSGAPPNRTASLAPNPRAPPQRTSSVSAATSSTLPSPKRPRQKVVLAPGHSPLDWAQLTTTTPHQQLAGVPTLQRVTPSLLKTMNGRKGAPAWSAFGGKVYNVGPYLPFHPGGEGELKRGAGRVGDKLFDEVHPWVNVENMLRGCLVGILVGEADTSGASELEEMD